MLLHITMTHTPDNCPGNEPEKPFNDFLSAVERLPAVARETGVKSHFFVWAAPEHAAYALLEADSLVALNRFLATIPIQQDYKITPVQHLQDFAIMTRAWTPKGK